MWNAAHPLYFYNPPPYIQQMYSVYLSTCKLIPLTAKHLPDIFSSPLKKIKVHPLHKHTLLKNLLLLHEFSLGLNVPRKVCASDLSSSDTVGVKRMSPVDTEWLFIILYNIALHRNTNMVFLWKSSNLNK